MADDSLYGVGAYSYDWYSFHMGSSFVVTVPAFTGNWLRVMSVASSFVVNGVTSTGDLDEFNPLEGLITISFTFSGSLMTQWEDAETLTETWTNVPVSDEIWTPITDAGIWG